MAYSEKRDGINRLSALSYRPQAISKQIYVKQFFFVFESATDQKLSGL